MPAASGVPQAGAASGAPRAPRAGAGVRRVERGRPSTAPCYTVNSFFGARGSVQAFPCVSSCLFRERLGVKPVRVRVST